MTFKRKIVFGFGLALIALLSVAVLSYRGLVNDEEGRRWITHTYQVTEKLDSVMTDLLNGETGVRGFIISGDELYLQPYREGMARLDDDMRELRALTMDSGALQALGQLEPGTRHKRHKNGHSKIHGPAGGR